MWFRVEGLGLGVIKKDVESFLIQRFPCLGRAVREGICNRVSQEEHHSCFFGGPYLPPRFVQKQGIHMQVCTSSFRFQP